MVAYLSRVKHFPALEQWLYRDEKHTVTPGSMEHEELKSDFNNIVKDMM